jgi:NAD(P)-dependent dehydrogenase (short-subunit alcohol dehydrogenase family)
MLPFAPAPLSFLPGLGARPRLKPLADQVVVVVGASSGIGRESARQCAARGAKVVIAARSEEGLASLVAEIEAGGGQAAYAVCDVTDPGQVRAVAELAIERFGTIDTWVSASAVGVYDMLERVSPDEFRHVLDVNVLGYLHCLQAALPHLRREGRGALIFITSIESTVAMPLQGPYTASKHAAEGMIEALRRELRYERVPVSVTNIKPAVINTPFYSSALSRVGFAPIAPPPAYHPSVVAQCVVHAAEHPVRDMIAGGAGRVFTFLQLVAPGVLDAAIGRVGIPLQRTGEPPGDNAFYEPRAHDNRTVGDMSPYTVRFSPYTWLQTHPKARAAAGAIVAVLAGRAIRKRQAAR